MNRRIQPQTRSAAPTKSGNEGTDGIVCCGTTGEAPTLNDEEHLTIIRETVNRVAGKIPVIAGCGSNCTRKGVTMVKKAKACGADACLVVVPYYNRPHFAGIKAHFDTIGEVGLPIIFYHHPSRTGIKLPAEQLVEICSHPMICGIKEGSCDLDVVQEYLRNSTKPLFSGDDVISLPQIAAGAQGVISIVANVIPKLWSEYVSTCLTLDRVKARELYGKLAPLAQAMIRETNPQGVKYALSLLGKCEAYLRLPMTLPQASTQRVIQNVMEKMGLPIYSTSSC